MAVPFEHPVNVRWRDTDALGHVNHAVFLTYLEEGRDAFFTQILGSDPIYVVVRLEVDLHAEVRYEDHRVTVRIEVERLGATSLTTHETILLTPATPASTEAGPTEANHADHAPHAEQAHDARRVAAQARVVTVRWDADRRKPTPFTEAERTRLTTAMASSALPVSTSRPDGAGLAGSQRPASVENGNEIAKVDELGSGRSLKRESWR